MPTAKCVKSGDTFKVVGFAMLPNFAEHFLITKPDSNDICECYVMAQFSEFGTVYSKDIEKFTKIDWDVSSDQDSEHFVLPPEGYIWV